jgi:HEPN domain-containing protein
MVTDMTITTPEWSLLLDKSKENLEAAEMLYKAGSYGLAAYHSQQSVETLFKSFVYKTLRKHREYSHSVLKSHLPLRHVMGYVADFVENMESKLEENKIRMLRMGIVYKDGHNLGESAARLNAIKKKFYEIKNYIDKLDSRDGAYLKDSLWLYSLEMQIKDDSEIRNLLNSLEGVTSEQAQDNFMEDIIKIAQVAFSHIDDINKTSNDKEYSSKARLLMLRFLTDRDFPKEPLTKILDGKVIDDSDRVEMRSFVEANGKFMFLSVFFGRAGMLNEILYLVRVHFPKTYEWSEKYFDIQSISYVSSICASMLPLYPHESFGRYPENIAGTTTEAVYKLKANKIKQYIDNCRDVYEHVKAMM